jgi:hypothetical protein
VVEVVYTDEFGEWFDGLKAPGQDAVARVVGLLESEGTDLGFPYSSAVEGSKVALRELRIKAKGRQLRVFYAFDPMRDAVLLIGGDKTGDDRFYERLIPWAEEIWETYSVEQKARKRE